jgi:hypothetical protein
MPGRLAYPKVAKPSKLDEFYQRRLQLKAVEERTLALTAEVRAKLFLTTTHIIIVLHDIARFGHRLNTTTLL